MTVADVIHLEDEKPRRAMRPGWSRILPWLLTSVTLILCLVPFLLVIAISFGRKIEGAAWVWDFTFENYQRFFVGALWPDEVTVRVRSVLDLMGLLSQGVEVPAVHLEENRATPAVHYGDDDVPALVPLDVRVQVEPPTDAFVAVEYAGHWYYIAHSDQASKQAFGLLAYLFQMQAPQIQGAGPLITIPTG